MIFFASYNWLKEYVRLRLPPEEFAARLSLSGPSVERSHRLGENLDKIVVGEVLKLEPHPRADKLRVAETRIGRQIVKIVCGGANLQEGMLAAVALPGARVRWHGQGDLVELRPTEIRGVKSWGMICSSQEIGLASYFPATEAEILDLTAILAPSALGQPRGQEVGRPLLEALGLADVVFEIEVTTNRPDAFSMVGLAREASAILNVPFLWKPTKPRAQMSGQAIRYPNACPLDLRIQAPKLCPRYQAVLLETIKIRPSPWWLQKRLLAAGIRPISNIVDITNYVMLELGQPLHAFDADRLSRSGSTIKIQVRTAVQGEKFQALDGQTYKLDPNMLVIADAARPIALAGVMGGQESGVSQETTRVIFESANFDPVSVRRTARNLNLHSDSSFRFEKGLSVESTAPAISRAVELAIQIAEARPLTPLLDRRAAAYQPRKFAWDPEASRQLIGVPIPVSRMEKMLASLGFQVKKRGKKYQVIVPYWRDHDLESSHDFAEEIARLHGYHQLPAVLPEGALPLPEESKELMAEERLREFFCGAGLTEVYSYSFISEKLLAQTQASQMPHLRVQNPLSSDLAIMRPWLTPSHLEIISENEAEFPEAGIFEVAKVYWPRVNDLPEEIVLAGGAISGSSPTGELFFQAKGLLEALAKNWSVDLIWERGSKIKTFLHPGRSAHLLSGGREIGLVGEIHPAVAENFKLGRPVVVFSFEIASFLKAVRGWTYQPQPVFPSARRDISFVVPKQTTYAEIIRVMKGASPLPLEFELFDIYEGQGIEPGKKSLAFHLVFSLPDRTLKNEEVEAAFDRLVRVLTSRLKAEVRLA